MAACSVGALSIPSLAAQTQQPVTHRTAPPRKSEPHTGRIEGIVVDSLHGTPLADADLLAEGNSVKPARTDSTGSFSIEGLTVGKYRLSAAHPTLDTLGIALVTPVFSVVADSASFVQLYVPSAAGMIRLRCGSSAGTSAIIGHVTSADSLTPVSHAEVRLSWTSYEITNNTALAKTPHMLVDTTKANGAYKFCGLPNDLQANLRVLVAGETRSELTLEFPDAGPALVARDIVLSSTSGTPSPKPAQLKGIIPVLATVSVTANKRDQALEKIGFTRRSEHSVGHFLTAEQIARKSDFRFTDLLRGIPGLQVGIDKYGDDVVASRRAGGSELNPTHGCVQYFVDGIAWGNGALEAMGAAQPRDSTAQQMMARLAIETARQLNTVLKKSEIIGIEVYQGGGAPTYFNQGSHNCATVVIWTTANVGM